MKAWLLDKLEGIGGLRLAEVDPPSPGAGNALVSLVFAGLNPADHYLATGDYPAKPVMPHVLGRDGVGIIEQLGAGCRAFKSGTA